jgi:D-alanyl-D-alanine carboxypeptidase
MRKILYFILLFFCICFISCNKKKELSPLDAFIYEHNIDIIEMEKYLEFERFNFYDFFELENLRTTNNYSYLETVNYFYTKNINTALLKNSDLILINKKFTLDNEYIPSLVNVDDYPIKVTKYNIQIQRHVLLNYINMINDLGLYDLYIYSGYRSYERQIEIFNNASNLNFVASPGTSEHQSGLVLDVSTLQYGLIQDFQYSKEFEILKNNCMNYGFIIRYPKNKENITGYYFEPWHLRFVGKDIAKYIMMNNLTLEEYIFKNIEL